MEIWAAPLNLITFKDKIFTVNEDVAKKLSRINKDLVIVSIAGTYRSGKSYLLNRLAVKSGKLSNVRNHSGFAMGGTVESVTKGIWVWYVDHPYDKNKGLLLMDTEGRDDPMRDDQNYDMSILSLALLLSSTFIYNVVGKIDYRTVETLQFIANISRHIRMSASDKTDADFDGIFPSFILAIRDATLRLKIDGEDVDEDKYMEKIMLKQSFENVVFHEKQNNVKKKLRKYFPSRKCFYFKRPSQNDDDLEILEKLPDSKLQESFLAKAEKFCQHIFTKAPPKKIDRIQSVNGRIFIQMVRIYLRQLNEGYTPCVESAVKEIAEQEDKFAVANSVSVYRESMLKQLSRPLSDVEFKEAHNRAHKQSFGFFFKTVFLEDVDKSLPELRKCLYKECKEISRVNAQNSVMASIQLLNKLFSPIKAKIDRTINKIDRTTNVKSNGYERFLDEVQEMKRTYYSKPNTGVMVDDAWKLFAVHTIMRADKRLYEKTIKPDGEFLEKQPNLQGRKNENHHRTPEKDSQRELDKIMSHRIEQQLETLLQSNQASKKLLHKVEELAQGYEAQFDARQKEHERLLNENSTQDAAKLAEEVKNLQQKSTRNINKYVKILTKIGILAGSCLERVSNPVVKCTGMAICGISYAVDMFYKD